MNAPAAELRLIVDFYDRMEGVLREHLTRLRAAGHHPAPAEQRRDPG